MSSNPNVSSRPPIHLSPANFASFHHHHQFLYPLSPTKSLHLLLHTITMNQSQSMEKKASRSREGSTECSNSDKLIDEKSSEVCGRERLKRHRSEMAGRVWIPETWGQENLLKDWTDCTAFDNSLFPKGLTLAREALVQGCHRDDAAGVITVEGSC